MKLIPKTCQVHQILYLIFFYKEEFEGNKEVIKILKSKDRYCNDLRKMTKGQKTIYKHTHKSKDRVT